MKSVALLQSSTASQGIATLLAAIWGVMFSPMPLLILLTILISILFLGVGMWKSKKDFSWSKFNTYCFGSLFGYMLVILLGTAGVLTGIGMMGGYAVVMGAVSFGGVQILREYSIAPPWINSIEKAIKWFRGKNND